MTSLERKDVIASLVQAVLREKLQKTKDVGYDESYAVELIKGALDELGIMKGFDADFVCVARKLDEAGVEIVLDDYVTELTIFAYDTTNSILDVR